MIYDFKTNRTLETFQEQIFRFQFMIPDDIDNKNGTTQYVTKKGY